MTDLLLTYSQVQQSLDNALENSKTTEEFRNLFNNNLNDFLKRNKAVNKINEKRFFLSGWKEGFKKISFTNFLKDNGYGLTHAKNITEDIMRNKSVTIQTSEDYEKQNGIKTREDIIFILKEIGVKDVK